MKKLLILCLAFSSQTFALVTDYTCTLIENGNVTNLSVNALMYRPGYKDNGDYILEASNNFGRELKVTVYGIYDNNIELELRDSKTLMGLGYIDGDVNKGEKGKKNPKKISFSAFDIRVECLRADNIEYPNH